MRQNWSGSNLTLNCWAQHRFFFLTSFLCPTILHTYLFPISSDLRKLVPSSRYCIERVFRPRKLDRFHPKELLECAFDIVTSTTNSSLPTAETIYTIYEIIQEFPALQVLSRSVTCCLVLIAEAEGPIPTAASCWVLEQIMAFLKQLQSLRVTLWASSWTRASTLTELVCWGGWAKLFSTHPYNVQEWGCFLPCSWRTPALVRTSVLPLISLSTPQCPFPPALPLQL